MRRREEIRSEIADLNEALTAFDALIPEPGTGAALMLAGLESRKEVLVTELQEAEAGELVLVLDGPHVTGSAVEVDLLAKLLRPLQDAVNSVAQAIRGTPTSAGLIEGATVDLSRMRLAGTFAGSFGLALVGPNLPEGEVLSLPLDGEEEESWPVFHQAVSRVLDVLEAAEDDETFEQAVVERVSGLGSRASAHLTALAAAFSSWDAPTQVLFRAPSRMQRQLWVDQSDAVRLQGVLTNIEETSAEQPIRGRLVEASLPRRTFGIETADEDVIRGRVDPDVVHRIEEYFGRDVDGTVVATQTRSRITGKEATTYLLVRFAGPLTD